MQALLNFATVSFNRRYESLLSDESKIAIVEMLFFVQNDIRLNQLASETQVQELWDSLRESEVKVDFLHGASQELRFLLDESQWGNLNKKLADAFTINYESAIEPEVPVGDDLLERMSNKEFLQAQLTLYPWLTILLLTDFLNLEQVLQGAKPKEETVNE